MTDPHILEPAVLDTIERLAHRMAGCPAVVGSPRWFLAPQSRTRCTLQGAAIARSLPTAGPGRCGGAMCAPVMRISS